MTFLLLYAGKVVDPWFNAITSVNVGPWSRMWVTQLRNLLTILGSDALLAYEKLYTLAHSLSPTLPSN